MSMIQRSPQLSARLALAAAVVALARRRRAGARGALAVRGARHHAGRRRGRVHRRGLLPPLRFRCRNRARALPRRAAGGRAHSARLPALSARRAGERPGRPLPAGRVHPRLGRQQHLDRRRRRERVRALRGGRLRGARVQRARLGRQSAAPRSRRIPNAPGSGTTSPTSATRCATRSTSRACSPTSSPTTARRSSTPRRSA